MRRKRRGNGTPAGLKRRKRYPIPCLRSLTATILAKTAIETQRVSPRLLVAVSEYGIIPIRLLTATKPKIAHLFR